MVFISFPFCNLVDTHLLITATQCLCRADYCSRWVEELLEEQQDGSLFPQSTGHAFYSSWLPPSVNRRSIFESFVPDCPPVFPSCHAGLQLDDVAGKKWRNAAQKTLVKGAPSHKWSASGFYQKCEYKVSFFLCLFSPAKPLLICFP